MPDPTDRPPDLSPAELEALLGRGSMDRWHSLAPADQSRIARDLEALQRTARDIAAATRQLHEDVASLDVTGLEAPPDGPEPATPPPREEPG